MQKIVTNRCYGGFGLSDKAMRRYAELKGLTLYPELSKHGFTTYWTVPQDRRPEEIDWHSASQQERQASNEKHAKCCLYDGDITRDDSALIQAVEELGELANGRFAELKVTEIPDGIEWEIKEYDGTEWVAEKHQTW